MKNTAVFFLTLTPSNSTLDFASEISKYIETYVVVDNPEYNTKQNINKVKILKTDLEESVFKVKILKTDSSKYKGINHVIRKPITSWDKVMYFLCEKLKHIDFAYIIEDDVFVPSVKSLINMIDKYHNYDLVTADNVSYFDSKTWPHWKKIKPQTLQDFEYKNLYKSMVAMMGISRRLLNVVKLYNTAYKHMEFLEMFFNSLCYMMGLKQISAPELQNIVWRRNWNAEDIHDGFFYHPIKDFEVQEKLRSEILQL
jgi:hypothetical protein